MFRGYFQEKNLKNDEQMYDLLLFCLITPSNDQMQLKRCSWIERDNHVHVSYSFYKKKHEEN